MKLVCGFLLALAVVAAEPIEPAITVADSAHWSFAPITRAAQPNTIDGFILARLAQAGLHLLPAADRVTLIRRVTFDLTGLPPTPAAVDAFVSDRSPQAFEKVVDRLLDSPAYGERWAQFWLDLARFAETDGFEHDKIRADAWKYRDWVIRAFNEDLPYDQFLADQLAADELHPGDAERAIATGFLLAGPDMPDINLQDERRHLKLNEMLSTVGTAFLGLTLGCAQCHDHKTDPISQADFYRMRAMFANTVSPKKDKPLGMVIREDSAEAPASHLMLRGSFRDSGPALEPGFVRVVNQNPKVTFEPAPLASSSGRRSALASWLTRPDHPLVTRVIVNWLWQQHFGRGLVETSHDFGRQGNPPSHPLLLDWLATELPARKWSLKAMHRLILTSDTYQRASRPNSSAWQAGMAADPENVLLWRGHRRRLEGEAIRDAMLAVAGRLSERRGGPGIRPPLPKEITGTLLRNQWKVSKNKADYDRRSIYLFARRNLNYPMFDVFDRPSADASCARRNRSTNAPQALTVLNSEFSLDMARAFAGRLLTSEDPITRGYRLALGRAPSEAEFRRASAFLKAQAESLRAAGRTPESLALPQPNRESDDTYAAAALVDLCLAIYNVSEFMYID
jgi:hypothetical protein